MNKTQFEILKKELNLELNKEIQEKFNFWEEIFLEYNSHTNLMSKNDTSFLFEKHVFDSLAILNWEGFKIDKPTTILDIGTGGGFPSVILAIALYKNPNIKIIANDSRIKKINFIKEAQEKLNLDNLQVLYSRIEDVKELNVDLILSRAVGKMKDVWSLGKKHLKKNGYFAIYKAKLLQEEIEEFKQEYQKINKSNETINFEVIKYSLPLEDNHQRNLIIFKKPSN